jgi:hypothetical protein
VPSPFHAGPPSVGTSQNRAEAAASSSSSSSYPNFATIDPVFVHSDAFWRLAATSGNPTKQAAMYTRLLKRIPLFRVPDGVSTDEERPGGPQPPSHGHTQAHAQAHAPASKALGAPLSFESSPLDPTQVLATCEYGSLLSLVSKRLYLEKRGTASTGFSGKSKKGKGREAALPPPRWRLQIDTLVVRRLVQVALAALEVEVYAHNNGLLFRARRVTAEAQEPIVVVSTPSAARRRTVVVKPWEMLLPPSRCRLIVCAAVVKAQGDVRKMAVLHQAMAVAEVSGRRQGLGLGLSGGGGGGLVRGRPLGHVSGGGV